MKNKKNSLSSIPLKVKEKKSQKKQSKFFYLY